MTAALIPSDGKHPRKSQSFTNELCLILSLIGAFCLATNLSLWFWSWPGNRAASANLMNVAMGDARRLFADHFFVKADAYFHSGMYPTIYDNRKSFQTPHIAEDSGAMKGKNTGDETTFLGPPRNWIDAFGRQFYPSVHTHLSEGGANGEEGIGTVGEILPWLKLSTELDPKRVEVYAVTAYWLRRMDKVDESEQELREGLKENPGDPQLLFDLGRLFNEARHNPISARNVWEAGLRNLASLPDKDSDHSKFINEQILASLARLEETEHHTNEAIRWLVQLKNVSTTPQAVQNWISKLQGRTNQ
jgi:hypothetical protein